MRASCGGQLPVTDGSGAVIGYVTLALNRNHSMKFVDHLTPMRERYTELPSAYEGIGTLQNA